MNTIEIVASDFLFPSVMSDSGRRALESVSEESRY